ncbi:TetR/AcrR family transcriptional regulator [Pseudomonas aeruginosa]
MSSTVPHRLGNRAKSGVRYQEARRKALELFAEHGFSRVGMRDLAAQLGIAPGSLYNHMESKEAVLFEFIEELYWRLLQGAEQVADGGDKGGARLRRLLDSHLRLHETMPLHFRLAEYELHYLSPEQRSRILTLRARYEDHWLQSITQLFGRTPCASIHSALRGIVSLLNHLPGWTRSPPGNHRQLQHDMVLGALLGALGEPIRSLDSVS